MTVDLQRTLAGIDASRRVGWAKAYQAEELGVLVTGYLLAASRLLRDGDAGEARAALIRCLSHLMSSESGRALIERTLEQNGYLRDWLEQDDAWRSTPTPEPPGAPA